MSSSVRLTALVAGAFALGGWIRAAAAETSASWSTNTALTVKASYDDNVFLQESGPLARRSSLISTIQPQLGFAFSRDSEFKAAFTYAPEVAFYHDEPGEDFIAHRLTHALSGTRGRLAWEMTGGFVLNDGPDDSVVYSGVGGAPAIGGFSTRDRRDAFVVRNNLKGTFTLDRWLLRAVASVYYHDFRSTKRVLSGYQNHSDRSDVAVGGDVGARLDDQFAAFVGARFGHWDHERLFDTGSAYDNDYVRVLASVEGKVRSNLKVTAVAGPGWHDFGPYTDAGFRERSHWFADVTATYTPARSEQITFTLRRYLQPSGSGRAISRDTIAECTWRHALSATLDLHLGLRAYRCDFEAPVVRDDFIVTPSARLAWKLNAQWNLEAGGTWDIADSRVPSTPAREFDRAIYSLSLRRAFP